MKTLIKHFDDIFGENAAITVFVWACSGGAVVLAVITFALMADYASEKELGFFTAFPFMEQVVSWKTLNLVYLLGVGLNLTFLTLYVRNSTVDFTRSYNHHLSSIKSLLLYSFLGYGGINLVIYPVYLVISIIQSFGKSIAYISGKVGKLSSNNLEQIVVNIQKHKQES